MYVLLVIASAGLFGKYPLIVYSIFIILVIYMIYKKELIYPKNKTFFILFFFSITYSIITYISKKQISSFILFGPAISYFSGFIISKVKNNDQNYINKCIIAIAVGFFAHIMLNYSINIASINRNTIDFWTREFSAATLQGAMLTMFLSLLFWVVFCSKKKILKILYIVGLIFSMAYIMIIASRTPIIIMSIVFVLDIILYNVLNHSLKNTVKPLLIMLIILSTFGILYSNNILNVKQKFEESNIHNRLEQAETASSDKSRITTQILAIESLIEHPLGTTENIGELSYAHNMWLDIGKEAGIIPCLLLIIYTIRTMKSVYFITKNENVPSENKILLVSIYIGININFLVEPIIEGIPFLFVMFACINGMVDTLYYSLRKEKLNENIMDS